MHKGIWAEAERWMVRAKRECLCDYKKIHSVIAGCELFVMLWKITPCIEGREMAA